MNTNNVTKGQLACINALLVKLGLEGQKTTLVLSFTNGRSESRGKLTSFEAYEFIRYLKSKDPDEIKAEKMRRKIISIAHEMGWRVMGTTKADMKRIDGWCVNYSFLKKKLNQYQYHELPALVTQFEKVYHSFLKGI